MAEVDADIWVLTETFTDRVPGPGHQGVFSPHHPDRRPDHKERWTAIWSKWPITMLDSPAPHRRGTVAAQVESPLGPVIVYGCVIAYGHEPRHDNGTPARAWEVHAAEVDRQVSEWLALREAHPGIPLVVAGDFNQGRSGRPRDYGTAATKRALTIGVEEARLRFLTEVDLVAAGAITERSHVEHICVSEDLRQVGPILAWDRTDASGVALSDHPTLAVDLSRASESMTSR